MSDIPELVIEVAQTWIRFKTTRSGMAAGVNLIHFVSNLLTEHEWNPREHRMITTARYTDFDPISGCGYMPRYALDSLLKYLSVYKLKITVVDISPVEPKLQRMKMKKDFTPRPDQVDMIDFCTDDSNGFKPVAIQTGGGKTAGAIASMVKLGYTTLIVLPMLINQWYKSLKQFTTLKSEDIYVIKGFDSLQDLWKMIEEGYTPKVLLCSTRTLALYCLHPQMPYDQIPPFSELQRRLGIGCKIIDECHMNFNTNTLIDYRCNIKVNIYLSATYSRSSTSGRKIFNMYFPADMKFGEDRLKKYSTAIMVGYHLNIFYRDTFKFKTNKGYNHSKYENYLLRHPHLFDRFISKVIVPMMLNYYFRVRKDGQRCLILTGTNDFAIAVAQSIERLYPYEDTSIYFSGQKEYGDAKNLESSIIVSTIKSCGTGRDIKELKTCINTVSFSSAPLAAQVFGRLREIKGEDTFYLDLWNEEIDSHRRHMENRSENLKYRAKQLTHIKV